MAAALALLTALLEAPALVLIVARSLRQSGELFRKVKVLYRALQRPVRPERFYPVPVRNLEAQELLGVPEQLTQESTLALELANGSRIISLPGNADTIVGFSGVSLLLVDEAARAPDSLYYLLRPMLAVSQGRLVCLSTPRGKRGWFYEAWQSSQPWHRIKITADECPRIPREFLAEERAALGDRWYSQEYLASFEECIDSVFSQADIDAALVTDVPPLFGA